MTRAQTQERTQIELRLVEPGELEGLLDMMQEFNQLEDIPWSRKEATPAVKRLLASPELGLIAYIVEKAAAQDATPREVGREAAPRDVVCGYLVLTWGFDLEWNGRDAFLTELYLLPRARGRGLGRKALPLIEQLAREHGAHALHLMVRPDNLAAVQLYRGAGYSTPPRTFMTKELVSTVRREGTHG